MHFFLSESELNRFIEINIFEKILVLMFLNLRTQNEFPEPSFFRKHTS